MEKTFNDIHPFPGAHVHVIGIGGASMSGLARILRERGYTVSGSDRVENEAVQALRADCFRVAVGHRAENVRGADLVVYSSAIPEDHVERLACVQERISATSPELMKKYDVAIWAHHGMFCSGEDFDLTFGLMHTVEKSAEILVKVLSMQPYKRQTIQPDDFRHLAKDFNVTLPEQFLYEKH